MWASTDGLLVGKFWYELLFYSLTFLLLLLSHSRLFRITEGYGMSSLRLRVYPSEVYLFALAFSPHPWLGALLIVLGINIPVLVRFKGLFPGSKRPLLSAIFRTFQVLPYILLGFFYSIFSGRVEGALSKISIVFLASFLTVYLNRLITSLLGQIHRYKRIKWSDLKADLRLDEGLMAQWFSSVVGYLISFSFFLHDVDLLNPGVNLKPPIMNLYLSLNVLGLLPFYTYRFFVGTYSEMNTVVSTLAAMIQERDSSTYSHSLRVKTVAEMIAKRLGLPEVEVQKIGRAALLHDLGKIRIPDSILFKPGKLEPHEFNMITFHPLIAFQIIKEFNLEEHVGAEDILYHHERYSGGGYPYNLKYDDIPIGARIISVSDVFDALASKRSYKEAMPLNEVMDFIRAYSGIYFDPKVVEKLHELYLDKKLEALYQTQGR